VSSGEKLRAGALYLVDLNTFERVSLVCIDNTVRVCWPAWEGLATEISRNHH